MAKNEPVPSWVLKPEAADEEIVVMPREAAQPEPGFFDTLGEYADVATRAIAPYATAATLGGAAGAPLAGVGAVPGAAAGVTALGLSDLGTGIYNVVAPAFGGERVPLPSQTIQNQFTKMGIGRAPRTAGQQVFSDVLQAGVGGGGQALGAKTLAPFMPTSKGQNFMQFLGGNARGQTAASMGGAAAPSVAANYFNVENPMALLGLSLLGGVAGGKAATPKPQPIPAARLKSEASDLYKQMEGEGVNIAPTAMTDLQRRAQQTLAGMKYDPDTDTVVTEALNLINKKAGQPITYDMLEKFRRSIRDLPYSQSGGKRGTNEERAMVKALDDLIDDFMVNLTPRQTTAGNAAAANTYLTQAREIRSRAYQTETIENAVEAARNRSKQGENPISYATALRKEFAKIVNNPRRLNKFDAETQAAIKEIANGMPTRNALDVISRLAPSTRVFGMQIPFLGVGATYSPSTAAIIGGLQATGMAARGTANRMTTNAVNNALIKASGVKPGSPGWKLLTPAAQQAVLSQERGRTATQRRDVNEPPSWVLQPPSKLRAPK